MRKTGKRGKEERTTKLLCPTRETCLVEKGCDLFHLLKLIQSEDSS
jgi:hypothetical protein